MEIFKNYFLSEYDYLFKPTLRITIYPDLAKIFEEYTSRRGTDLTSEDKLKIQNMYPPIVLNKYPDEFSCNCSITRKVGAVSELILEVLNLSAYSRLHILNANYKCITVEAGYLGPNWKSEWNNDLNYTGGYFYDNNKGVSYRETNLKILFKGHILWMTTEVQSKKEITTKFIAISGTTETLSAYSNLMSVSYDAGYNLYQLIHEVYVNSDNPDIKLNISEENRDKLLEIPQGNVNPYTLSSVLSKFSINMNYDWEGTGSYSMDDYIYISDPSKIDNVPVHIVNEETGLIDLPSLDNQKIKFKMIFNPDFKVFDLVKLNNYDIKLPSISDASGESLAKAYSGKYLDSGGIYRINEIIYTLNTRGSDFCMEITAIALGIYDTITGKSKS